MLKKKLNKKGFTLIETIIYFAIFAAFMAALMSYTFDSLDLTRKSDSLSELQSNIHLVLNHLTHSIQEADSVNAGDSTFDDNTGRLNLNMPTAAIDPTILYLDDGKIYMDAGANPTLQITSDLVNCTQLQFQHISGGTAADQIVIDMSCDISSLNRPSGPIIRNLHSTISLRQSS